MPETSEKDLFSLPYRLQHLIIPEDDKEICNASPLAIKQRATGLEVEHTVFRLALRNDTNNKKRYSIFLFPRFIDPQSPKYQLCGETHSLGGGYTWHPVVEEVELESGEQKLYLIDALAEPIHGMINSKTGKCEGFKRCRPYLEQDSDNEDMFIERDGSSPECPSITQNYLHEDEVKSKPLGECESWEVFGIGRWIWSRGEEWKFRTCTLVDTTTCDRCVGINSAEKDIEEKTIAAQPGFKFQSRPVARIVAFGDDASQNLLSPGIGSCFRASDVEAGQHWEMGSGLFYFFPEEDRDGTGGFKGDMVTFRDVGGQNGGTELGLCAYKTKVGSREEAPHVEKALRWKGYPCTCTEPNPSRKRGRGPARTR
ncbi:hypothetical protein MKZ38_001642 [Zalerion maritima]|uniref:Uncharacterized protein n=1 Tax=Zalerion maritima TaxID=339359 RepID=A0AAD5RRL0_9PEZI|nr:hypothetical protein MKZ38_001642 [Zalerion maritima]